MPVKLLKKSWKIIREGGFTEFKKKVFDYIFFRIKPALLLLLMLKLKFVKFSNEDKLFDYITTCFGGMMAPMQIKQEFVSLLKLIKEKKPRVILEIGTAKGGTLFCFSKILPNDSLLISIDLPGGDFGGGYPSWKKYLYKSFATKKQIIKLLRVDSHRAESYEKVKEILGKNKIDFLFIDADHTYEGVKRDFELYSNLVSDGGIIALHDIVKCSPDDKCKVEEFWSQIKKQYKYKEYISSNLNNFGIGVIYDYK